MMPTRAAAGWRLSTELQPATSELIAGAGPAARYLPHPGEPMRKDCALRNSFPRPLPRHDAIGGGRCPIEAGLVDRLTDHECAHGRLPADRTPRCGCWPQEAATVIPLHSTAGIETAAVERRAA